MFAKISIYENQYGRWRIERTTSTRGYRYMLWCWSERHKAWALIANQGRRKTCIELANVNYRGGRDDI